MTLAFHALKLAMHDHTTAAILYTTLYTDEARVALVDAKRTMLVRLAGYHQ